MPARLGVMDRTDKTFAAILGLMLTGGSLMLAGELGSHFLNAEPSPQPDTAGFWQQANTAKQIECRDLVLAEVLRMQLPAEAYTDPALATAMQQGFEMCLLKNKVLI
jgi:hypothetical protein